MFNKSPFHNKYVTIVQKSTVDSEMNFKDDLPNATTSIPMVHEGTFALEDASYIYLADKHTKKIVVGIHKSDVSYIELADASKDEEKLTYYIENFPKYEH